MGNRKTLHWIRTWLQGKKIILTKRSLKLIVFPIWLWNEKVKNDLTELDNVKPEVLVKKSQICHMIRVLLTYVLNRHTTKWPCRVKVGWPEIWILGQGCQVKNCPNFNYEIWAEFFLIFSDGPNILLILAIWLILHHFASMQDCDQNVTERRHSQPSLLSCLFTWDN